MESKDDSERVSLDPLDPITALKGFLAVDPESEPSGEPEMTDEDEAEAVEQAEPDRDD